jgi:hypothetical protein
MPVVATAASGHPAKTCPERSRKSEVERLSNNAIAGPLPAADFL